MHLEREEGALLGYEDWQKDFHVERLVQSRRMAND
jgi:hypothetical protein